VVVVEGAWVGLKVVDDGGSVFVLVVVETVVVVCAGTNGVTVFGDKVVLVRAVGVEKVVVDELVSSVGVGKVVTSFHDPPVIK